MWDDSWRAQLRRGFWRGVGYRLARGVSEIPELLVYAVGAWVLFRHRGEVAGWLASLVHLGVR